VSEGTDAPEESGPAQDDPEPNPLDVLLFAPVGLAMTVVEDLPGLIDKGRRRVELEISNARVMGQWVVTKGQKQVTRHLTGLLHTTQPPAPDPATDEHATPGPPAAAPRPAADPADSAMVERTFAGYDTLSASQVVRRLDSLDPELLGAVQRYEASHRNRRTILSRAQQLLDGEPGPTPAPPADGPAG